MRANFECPIIQAQLRERLSPSVLEVLPAEDSRTLLNISPFSVYQNTVPTLYDKEGNLIEIPPEKYLRLPTAKQFMKQENTLTGSRSINKPKGFPVIRDLENYYAVSAPLFFEKDTITHPGFAIYQTNDADDELYRNIYKYINEVLSNIINGFTVKNWEFLG